jgi:hypothetical protein
MAINASRATAFAFCAFSLLAPRLASAADNVKGIDLFIEACHWQGTNPAMIRTGYAEFEVAVTTTLPTDADIRAEIDSRCQGIREAIATQPDPKIRAVYETALTKIPELVRVRRTGKKQSRIKVLFAGNSPSGKRRYDVANYDPAIGGWERPVFALRRDASKEGGDNAMYDESALMATLGKTTYGVVEFQAFGRMQGTPSRFATAALLQNSDPDLFKFSHGAVEKFKADVAQLARPGTIDPYQLAGKTTYERGAVAYIVETRAKPADALLQRYWIDPSRGHVCPLIQLYDSQGRLVLEWRSASYFLHVESGLWFPASCIYTEYSADTGAIRKRTDYRIDQNTLKLNQPVSDEEFTIQIPEGATVLDARGAKQRNYRAVKATTLSFAENGLDLGSKPLALATSAQTSRPR